MGHKAKAPATPDYAALQKQQQDADTANYEKELADQRSTQVTPQGTLSWTQDPTTGQWTQTTSYNPQTQAAYDKYMANQSQSLDVQNQANSQLQNLMSQGAWQDPGLSAAYSQDYANKYADQMQQTLTARMQPQYTQDQNAMQTKLSLQGLQPGTEAYDRAYKNLLTSQGDVMSQANLQAQLAGQSEARNQYSTELQGQQAVRDASMQDYLLPWQTASAAQGLAGQITTPSFSSPTTSTPTLQTPDILGTAQQTYAQQMQQYNEKSASNAGKGKAIGSVAGGIAGSFFGPVGTMAGSAIGGYAGGAIAG